MERLEIATKAKAGIIGYNAFCWHRDVPYTKRKTEYRLRFKKWEQFVGDKYVERLLTGLDLHMGIFIGKCVVYRTKIGTVNSNRYSIDWKETKETGKVSYYDYGNPYYLQGIKVWVLDNHFEQRDFLYPRIAPKYAKAFYKKAYDNIENFQVAERKRKMFLRDTGCSGKAAFDELYQRYKFENNVLIEAGGEILGLQDDKMCLEFADAYNECFYNMTHACNRNYGKAYHGFLLFSRTHTEFKYLLAEKEWNGIAPILQEDGYLMNLARERKVPKLKLKYPSHMVHYIFWLCKRQSPDTFLHTSKTVRWVYKKLQEEGETGIPIEYVAYLGERFHKPYINNFKRAFQYNKQLQES